MFIYTQSYIINMVEETSKTALASAHRVLSCSRPIEKEGRFQQFGLFVSSRISPSYWDN